MSHIFKTGNSLFTTGGSIIKVKDTIQISKQPINIGFNYPSFVEFDEAAGRYYIASTNTIKVFDLNFTLLTSVSIGGIVSMQLDAANNRLIITDKNTPSFWAVSLTNYTVTAIFSPGGVNESIKFGYYDIVANRYYIATNQIYVYSSSGMLVGMINDNRIPTSGSLTINQLVLNPHTGLLMICIPGKILLADTDTLLVQAGDVSGAGVTSPNFIRFDTVNLSSYWLSNGGDGFISEMAVATNSLKRILTLNNSISYSLIVENRLGLYSICIADAGYNQFYRLRERLV